VGLLDSGADPFGLAGIDSMSVMPKNLSSPRQRDTIEAQKTERSKYLAIG